VERQHTVSEADNARDGEVKVKLACLALRRLELPLQVYHLDHIVMADEDSVLLQLGDGHNVHQLVAWHHSLRPIGLFQLITVKPRGGRVEMIITPDLEYPIVCVNVRRGYDGRSLKLDMINLNSSSSWFHSDELEEADGTQTVVPRHELMNIVSVTQLEKDTILVCHDNMVKVVNL
jgi:hypothetical protein